MNRIVRAKDKAESRIIADEINARAEKLKSEILEAKSNVEIIGTKYYVSESGNDSNDGLSPEAPIKSLSRASELPLHGGDGVLFKRGDIFRGFLKAKQGVTYSAYGEGKKPALYNSARNYADPSLWVKTDVKNVYKLTIPIMNDVGVIVFNDGEAHTEKRIKGRDNFKDGKLSDLDCDLCMWHDVSEPRLKEGFVYLRSDKGNPAERFSSIEVASRCNIISVGGPDITFDNLTIKYGAAHGIGAGSAEGLTVQYCEFGWIGGSWFRTDTLSRFGNAIEIYGGCRGYVCDHNYIYQIYDAGITHQFKNGDKQVLMIDVRYTDNLIEDTSYSIEYFLTEAVDVEPLPERYMKNVEICGNILRRSGYGFGDQRPDRGAAAHIKGWNHTNRAWNYSLHDNIFDRGKYMLVHIGSDDEKWLPEMSHNTYVFDGSETGTFGIFGTSSCKYPVDDSIEKLLSDTVKEKDGTFVFEDAK